MNSNDGAPVHDARWHLREAEILLEEADDVDEAKLSASDGNNWKRYSFAERATAHAALAKAMESVIMASLH
jgi:acyl-CoA reductase-like NAD-dependent aldehyde dehydrogenase